MRRLIGIVVGLSIVGASFAQGTFTIRRPADGSVVRETVAIRIPKNSVPSTGYVGFWVNGKFLEASVPDVVDNDYVFKLDTKKYKIPDGKMTLEAVLYVDYQEAPKIVNRSSVEVILDNASSIRVPPGGFKLRYKFKPLTELIYDAEFRTVVSTLSEAEMRRGGRPAELPLDPEKFRMLYSIESASPDAALIRMQAMPNPGKDYVRVTLGSDAEQKKYPASELAPIYMKISNTGKEIFGAAPIYVPMMGSSGEGNVEALFADFPLPVLPPKPVKPGDFWAGTFNNGYIDIDNIFESNRFSLAFPARGTVEGIEWQNGIPCAKLRNTIAVGTTSPEGKKLQAMGRAFADDKIELDETVWFALDRGIAVKIVRNMKIDRKVEGGSGTGMGSGPAGNAGAGSPGTPGAGKNGGKGGAVGSGMILPPKDSGAPGGNFQITPGGGGKGGNQGGAGSRSLGAPPRSGGAGGQNRGGFGGGGRGGSSGGAQYVRIVMQQVLTIQGF